MLVYLASLSLLACPGGDSINLIALWGRRQVKFIPFCFASVGARRIRTDHRSGLDREPEAAFSEAFKHHGADMNFSTPEEHRMLTDAMTVALDRSGQSLEAVWEIICDMGLPGMCVAESHGGSALDPLALGLITETIAKHHAGAAALLASHVGTACAVLESQEEFSSLLGDLLAGRVVGGGCLPSGACLGVRFAPSIAISDGAVWAVRETESAELVFDDVLLVDKLEDKRPLTPSSAAELPTSLCLIGLAGVALGVGKKAFETGASYATERQQFGRPISRFQAIQWMLADSSAELDAASLLMRRAAASGDRADALMAARFAGEKATRVADHALQIHGGYGYTREYPVERYWRHASHLINRCLGGSRALAAEEGRLIVGQDR